MDRKIKNENEIDVSIINAVEFCSNIISRNGPSTYIPIERIELYRDIAATEIKTFVNSKEKLKELLCQFPLVFKVVGNSVTLRNWIIFHLNQQKWLKGLTANTFQTVPIFIIAIQFYCNELFKKPPRFELHICQLFKLRSKAPIAVQAVTRNIKEFELFLKLYPEIFDLKNDKVLLSTPATFYRSLKTWIRRLLYGDFTFSMIDIEDFGDNSLAKMKFYEILKNEIVVYESVDFLYRFILDNASSQGMPLETLKKKSKEVVPLSTHFKNLDLGKFMTSYSELFTLCNGTVFLTDFYKSIIFPEEDEINCNRSEADGLDIKKCEETVISFYLGLLNDISNILGKIKDFPINLLVYYNVIAPPEVKNIAKNAEELKNFLLQYPETFKINNDDFIVIEEEEVSLGTNHVMPTSIIDSNISGEIICKKKLKAAVGFYSNIINELGGIATIEKLCGYTCQANNEVQIIGNTFEELKNFLSSQQNDFIVLNDRVYLINNHRVGDLDVIMNSKPNAIENAICFYSSVLRKNKSDTLSLIRMSGHRGSAPADVKSVAKNPKELKSFLSKFPEVFTIVGDFKVMLSQPSEKKKNLPQEKKILPLGNFCNDSEQDAVEFFSKMLNHYGICRVLSINKLFELKLKSSAAVQKISGSNINQFLNFLKKYPQEFLVTNDNVIARKKMPKWSYSGNFENKKFTDPLLLLIFNFFKTYTSNKSIFHIDYLYNNVGRCFLYNNETPVFPSKSDLLLFLGLYPQVFFVDYYRIVNVLASSKKAYMSEVDKKQFRFIKQNNQNVSSTIKPKTIQPIIPKSESTQNLSGASLILEKKPSGGLDGSISYENKSSKNDTKKCAAPKQPKKGLSHRAKYIRKTKLSTNVFPVVESSISEESLVSEQSKNYDDENESQISLCNGLELEDNFWDNQYSPCWRNEFEGEFNPPNIEDIENTIFANFICNVNKNYHLSNNENLMTPDISKILNNSLPKKLCEKIDCNALITETLMFLNDKLWEGGNLKIININELFLSFSNSGLEISKYCCKSATEFQDFLSKFPNHFIISQENVMARRNKIQKGSILNKEEESLPLTLFNFFKTYTKHYNFIRLKLLYSQVGRYFYNINRVPFFKSHEDLIVFFKMFPEVFWIDNNQIINRMVSKGNVYHKVKFNSGVIKIDSFLDKKLYSMIANEKYPSVPESTEGWQDYVLQKTQIVENLSQCKVVTAEILDSEKVIALDCEGVNLGAAGRLTLVQIALVNGKVYVFDIVKDRSMVNDGGLKDIMESESIVKVIHDSRNDVANLYTEYGVKITHIFDTRVAHHLIINLGVNPKRISSRLTAIGFNELCSKYGANLNVQKDVMKNVYKYNPSYWARRPLTKDMLAYAALDVASLVPQIFFNMLKQLKGVPEKTLWELSGKHSLSVLNDRDLLFD